MSTSTTTIISIRTTILTGTSIVKAATTGNTIHNTVATRRTATEGRRTSSVVRVRAEPGIAAGRAALAVPEDPGVLVALAVLGDPVGRAALAVSENLVVPAAWVVLAVPEDLVAPENLAALENLAVPEDQVVLESLAVPAELVPGRGAEAEAGPMQVLETEHPRGRLVVPQGTKSVTAVHHRGRAVVLVAGDLAAVVEATRERAVRGAVVAWAEVE
jgi:hypothetical protein